MTRSTPSLLPALSENDIVNAYAKSMAVGHHGRLTAARQDYELECQEWARQGFRPEHCIHGTYMWDDYDRCCGECEDGSSDLELAVHYGRADARDLAKRLEVYCAARDAGFPLDIVEQMWKFVEILIPMNRSHRRNRLSKAGV